MNGVLQAVGCVGVVVEPVHLGQGAVGDLSEKPGGRLGDRITAVGVDAAAVGAVRDVDVVDPVTS